jgi:predicted nucleic acid-binding protein
MISVSDNVLQKLTGQVIIPQAVYNELQDAHTPKQVKDWVDSNPSWIEVRQADLQFYTAKKNLEVVDDLMSDGQHSQCSL